MNQEQVERIGKGRGFIAALDQSGGSTPKALRLYGVEEAEYSSETEMFDLIHAMRTRMITSPAFDGNRVLGAILFEGTMDRQIEDRGAAQYLWEVKKVVPFLKVDKGLAEETDGVQLMKPMDDLDSLLARARDKGVFGTKMRSVIKDGTGSAIRQVVAQQFRYARQILAAGLVPIVEPEVDINSPIKAQCEAELRTAILEELEEHSSGNPVMLKLTLPESDDFYSEFTRHRGVLRVVALSGGYSRDEANARLSRNHGMIASFSRALTEGLSARQSDEEFNSVLNASIESIFQASIT